MCKNFETIYLGLSYRFPDAKFYKIEASQQLAITNECGIKVLPTVLLYQCGSQVSKIEGNDVHNLHEQLQCFSKIGSNSMKLAKEGTNI